MSDQLTADENVEEIVPLVDDEPVNGKSKVTKVSKAKKVPAAAKVAKRQELQLDENNELVVKTVIETGEDGKPVKRDIRVRLKPVAPYLLYEVVQTIKKPVPPTYTNPENNREEFNYSSPQYQLDQEQYGVKADEAVADALILFGVEVVGEYPNDFADDEWVEALRYMKVIDKDIDTDDVFTRKLLYKKFVLGIGQLHIQQLSQMSAVTQEDIATARDSFPGQP
jgi:hypothetical protein